MANDPRLRAFQRITNGNGDITRWKAMKTPTSGVAKKRRTGLDESLALPATFYSNFA